MPRLIFKCPYIKGGTSSATAHLENYVKYMATRNGVERIDPGRSEWPATSKAEKDGGTDSAGLPAQPWDV